MSLPDRSTAINEAHALALRLRTAGATAKTDHPNPALVGLLRQLARERASQGDLLTQISRLPLPWPPVVKLCLFGLKPYEEGGASALFTLRNVSDRPLQIEVDLDIIVDKRRSNAGEWVDGETWKGIEKHRTIEPGAEIELSGNYAVLNLQRYSRSIYEPPLWDSSSAIPETDDLIEVGYRCLRWGEEYSGRRKEEKARKDKAA